MVQKIQYEQENYEGDLITVNKVFKRDQDFESWKKEMIKSSSYLNKPFKIIKVEICTPST